MVQEQLVIEKKSSKLAKLGGLIVTLRKTSVHDVDLIIGSPGFPNLERTLQLGDAVLFETPEAGLLEVRVMSIRTLDIEILVSQISPRPGIAGGFVDSDPSNSSFTKTEIRKIAESVEHIRLEMSKRNDVKPEQLDFIYRKLEEMRLAGERLGRKDWKNLAIGTLTGIIFNAALGPDIGKALFQVAGTALSWLFNDGLNLLPM